MAVTFKISSQRLISFFMIQLLFLGDVVMKCIHDDISFRSAPTTILHYQERTISRQKRNENSTDRLIQQLQPLRIHLHHSPSISLDEKTADMLKTAIQKAVQKISSVLSVVAVEGPIVLSRADACPVILRNGINKGKCSRIRKGYRGEYCLNFFRIPDAHLEGLSIYNSSYACPIQNVYSPGPGVHNADIILYVTSMATGLCVSHDQSVIAFASHCQVDQTGRPIAGVINFCPFSLMRSPVTEQFLYTISLHEIFHVLGFSTSLFDKFRACRGDICETVSAPIRSVKGQLRLVTPTVVNKTRKHFGCQTEADFGGPLQMKNSKALSHWDSLMMQTSLMTSEEDITSVSVLDPITLAVFEDSGWYKANFTQADPLLWGRGAGCLFGLPDHCLQDRQYFCSQNSSGCHFLLQDKAVCDVKQNATQCGVFIPVSQGSCVQDLHKPDPQTENLEIFSNTSRCFLSTVTASVSQVPAQFIGQCYKRWCSENGTVFVKVGNTDWVPCPADKIIQVPGFQGEIHCPPNAEIVCHENKLQQTYKVSTEQPKDSTTFRRKSHLVTPATNGAPETNHLLFIFVLVALCKNKCEFMLFCLLFFY